MKTNTLESLFLVLVFMCGLTTGLLFYPFFQKPPVVNVGLQPLFDEMTGLRKQNQVLKENEKKLTERSHEYREYTRKRCVCMFYDNVDHEPKTKEEICNAEDDDLYFWEE